MRQLPPEAALVGNLGTFGATGEQDRVCQRKQGSTTRDIQALTWNLSVQILRRFLAKWEFFFFFGRRCNFVLHRGLPGARVAEGGGPGVVVDKVADALPRVTDLPTFGQGILILQPATRIRTCVVIFGANTHTHKKKCLGLKAKGA